MVSGDEDVEAVSVDDLRVAWQTLTTVMRNYEAGSLGEASLVEARRLIEVEVRMQHGDEAWGAMVDSSEGRPR